jgi:hypothetical protein
MVFNVGMTDSEIISHYGGPTSFAKLLGLTTPGSVQRVSNWVIRGIPADVKLQHPHLFGITIGAIAQAPELADPAASQAGQGA